MKTLPAGIIADTLNRKTRRVERGDHNRDDHIPMVHVSSLIKSNSQDFFCPREFVLKYMEREDSAGAGIPPKFELLYGVGHFYGDYVVKKFVQRNPEWAQYMWGDWRCLCGHTTRTRECLPQGVVCDKCGYPCSEYLETDLFNPARTVIGHADLIFLVDGRFYIYEFKSIERQDIVFDNIQEPLGDHLTQASNYYYMLKSEGKSVSKQLRFVYIDRSLEGLYTKDPFKEVRAKAISASRLKFFYSKVKRVHDSIEKGVLPVRLCESITDSRAKQCAKAVSCFSRKRKTIKRIP